jgi:hypothetical protein
MQGINKLLDKRVILLLVCGLWSLFFNHFFDSILVVVSQLLNVNICFKRLSVVFYSEHLKQQEEFTSLDLVVKEMPKRQDCQEINPELPFKVDQGNLFYIFYNYALLLRVVDHFLYEKLDYNIKHEKRIEDDVSNPVHAALGQISKRNDFQIKEETDDVK